MSNTPLLFDDELRTDSSMIPRTKKRDFVPPFALNDEQLKAVIYERALRYCHLRSRPAWQELNARATELALTGFEPATAAQDDIQKKHTDAVKRAHGFMELCLAIAWRSWREGMSSAEVADSLSISPWQVRQSLRRTRAVATALNFDVGKRHHSFESDATK